MNFINLYIIFMNERGKEDFVPLVFHGDVDEFFSGRLC
jgi:hypothetical protein